MNAREVARMAIALAAERDWPVFPVTARKTPTIPGKGGHAHASTDPATIAAMWADHPGPLIGVRTGATSGISVLDIDSYVPSANQWLASNSHRLARTETYETRRSGVHLYYAHPPGLRCSVGQIAPGVDIKADGGYVVWWHAIGLACLDRREPASWPEWCVPDVPTPKTSPNGEFAASRKDKTDQSGCYPDRVEAYIRTLLARISSAPDGCKHYVLLRCSRAIGGVITSAQISADVAHQRISDALALNPSRIRNWLGAYRTISDGLADGMQHPFTLADRPYGRQAA